VSVLHFPLRSKILLSFIVLSLKKNIYEWNKFADFETSEVRTITLGRDCVGYFANYRIFIRPILYLSNLDMHPLNLKVVLLRISISNKYSTQ
jgi:hypothetical protein